MPILKKIVVQNFRNIEFQELEFSPNVNCISGGNGEGKTNLLDAIHYLSMTKSAFSTSDKFNFRHGTDSFTIAGTYIMDNGLESKFAISVSASGEKKLKRDDKFYKAVSEHIGILPIVLVSPSDSSMVSESGEERRRFVNAMLSQMSREYLSDMQQYNRLLQQRNKLLKDASWDDMLLSTFDAQMSIYADRISSKRRELVDSLTPIIQDYYYELSSGKEEVSIEYKTDLEKGSLEDILKSCREKDSIFKYTTAGIQRDDFIFTMNGFPIRKCGSQGQQKSFLVSLKFAQYELMKQKYGYAPILLLDDLFDKLDMGRVSSLLSMVAGSDFGQIFLTDSNKVRMSSIVDGLTEDRSYIETVAGTFKKVEG
ncbi:MAG: DNA replication and repair protein RecF [Bacteroidales bacterium]|nr:DNA replication and repair protein RecF [Bacteroidales bacterium]